MEELDLSWADNTLGAISQGANEIISGWAAGTAARLRGDDGQRAQTTTADQYDQRVQTPDNGMGDEVVEEISGTLSGMKWLVIGGLALGVAAFVYSRS